MYLLLRKSHHLLRTAYLIWKKSKKYLSHKDHENCKLQLQEFQDAILKKDQKRIEKIFPQIKSLLKTTLKLPSLIKTRNFSLNLGIAIIAAFGLIRPMWFELYQIPSGSMRPTLKELDRLTVSKTQFGINIPLTTGHFIFDPQEVLRNGVCIFTGEGMNIQDGKTTYFYLFNGYKQYIKRLIGKPGDLLYFYGGKIYGIDREGKNISNELNPEFLQKIDHIPFLNFEGIVKPKGRTIQNVLSPIILYQNNLPIVKLQSFGPTIKSELLYSNGKPVNDYYELFGIGNFGISRIVKKDRYYLEVIHHPSIKGAKLEQDLYGRKIPSLNLSKSYIPLEESHLQSIFKNLYTTRFVVKDGFMKRISQNSPPLNETSSHVYPKLADIPDGTYEFEYGIPYQILAQGIRKKLDSSHPLGHFSIDKAIFFYNYGIEFDLAFSPDSPYKIFPSRYTYYRFGDLFLMGACIFEKNDPTLVEFVSLEKDRQTKTKDFIPFIDDTPPIASNGTINKDFIKQFGLQVPDKSYYVLGDNHAQSADSRRFGFVPEQNLRGVPDILFWPLGERLGKILQTDYPLLTPSRMIIWIFAIIGYIVYRWYQRMQGIFPYNFISKDE